MLRSTVFYVERYIGFICNSKTEAKAGDVCVKLAQLRLLRKAKKAQPQSKRDANQVASYFPAPSKPQMPAALNVLR